MFYYVCQMFLCRDYIVLFCSDVTGVVVIVVVVVLILEVVVVELIVVLICFCKAFWYAVLYLGIIISFNRFVIKVNRVRPYLYNVCRPTDTVIYNESEFRFKRELFLF